MTGSCIDTAGVIITDTLLNDCTLLKLLQIINKICPIKEVLM